MNALMTRFKGWWPEAVTGLRRFGRPVERSVGDRLWILISLSGVLVLTGGWLLIAQSGYQIAREHGPMENVQAAFLLIGLFALLRRAWLEKASGEGIMCVAMAWAYFIFFVLEFDVRPFGAKWASWLNGTPRTVALALGSLAGCIWVIRNFTKVMTAVGSWLHTLGPTLLGVSAAFWLAGNIAEHSHSLPKATSLFIEELMENNATWLMLMAALYVNRKRVAARENG